MHSSIYHSDSILETALDLLEACDGPFWIHAKGESMLPLVRNGDRLQVEPCKDLPQLGEILIFRHGIGLVAHRLLCLSLNPQGEIVCLAQGDYALSPDPPIGIEHVAGRAVTLRREERVLNLNTPIWQKVGRAVSAFQSIFLGIGGKTHLSLLLRYVARSCIVLFMKLTLVVLKW